MDLGFETIGNATLICHDRSPILATDPWIVGDAYFGSWTRSHEVPDEHIQAIRNCRYVWISHGHPDHLSMESLAWLRDKTILLPDHAGGRIAHDLRSLGFRVSVLRDYAWTELSPRIRILSIADVFQDAVLLVDLGGRLLVNTNDAQDNGWGYFVKRTISKYEESFLLKLFGYGDADMINFIDEKGERVEPIAARKFPVGESIQYTAEAMGVRYVIPFSSMHKYQRADSAWANQYTTPLADYPRGFASTRCALLPAFISYDAVKKDCREIAPPETSGALVDPKDYGDDWQETLEREDIRKLEDYFRRIEYLPKALDFITFRVGDTDHRVEFKSRHLDKGIIFEAPRRSLIHAVGYECFDDLLIGNFMKTRLEGRWQKTGLFPDFTPYVPKYSDNGRAKTDDEVKRYLKEYRTRAPVNYLRQSFVSTLKTLFLSHVGAETDLYRAGRKTWRFVNGLRFR